MFLVDLAHLFQGHWLSNVLPVPILARILFLHRQTSKCRVVPRLVICCINISKKLVEHALPFHGWQLQVEAEGTRV